MSPITGPLVDKMGRKKAALLYCGLEIFINTLEQFPILTALITSRMIGGFTTNLLHSVFETWLDTEYRRRGLDKEKYEIIMRDSVIVSNLAAIGSGYLAHLLAQRFGNVGPFEGAVTCTAIAFVVVMLIWSENYGSVGDADDSSQISVRAFMKEAVTTFKSNKEVCRVGIIQGLTSGSMQIFIFLWTPALRDFATFAPEGTWLLEGEGQPAYGLIFGWYMAAGVLGGICAPHVRRIVTLLLTPMAKMGLETVNVEGEGEIRPMAVEFLAASCYLFCAMLLAVPFIVSGPNAFVLSFGAFMTYEFMLGLYMPSEGVIRSIYFPTDARASVMALPSIIVNTAVSLGVVSTNVIS